MISYKLHSPNRSTIQLGITIQTYHQKYVAYIRKKVQFRVLEYIVTRQVHPVIVKQVQWSPWVVFWRPHPAGT